MSTYEISHSLPCDHSSMNSWEPLTPVIHTLRIYLLYPAPLIHPCTPASEREGLIKTSRTLSVMSSRSRSAFGVQNSKEHKTMQRYHDLIGLDRWWEGAKQCRDAMTWLTLSCCTAVLLKCWDPATLKSTCAAPCIHHSKKPCILLTLDTYRAQRATVMQGMPHHASLSHRNDACLIMQESWATMNDQWLEPSVCNL